MTLHDLTDFRHDHAFDPGNRAGERRTWVVVGITAVTMVAEIVAGWITGSMALLADGWHMATHVLALSIAGVAYALARRWSGDQRFAFGTWKVEVLGAFSSALLLGVVAVAMAVESIARFVRPEAIQFGPALVVATLGLVVNLACALVLMGATGASGHAHDHGLGRGHGQDHDAHRGHDHDHGQGHAHDPAHDHAEDASVPDPARAQGHDLNLKSAYVHVVADAFTSVLAIVALATGLWAGWAWLDPLMGVVGAAVILWWAKGLLGESARALLDCEMDSPLVDRIRAAVQSDGDAEIADLHVWRVGRASYAAVLTVVADRPLAATAYRARLAGIPTLKHVSVEVNRCPHGGCPEARERAIR